MKNFNLLVEVAPSLWSPPDLCSSHQNVQPIVLIWEGAKTRKNSETISVPPNPTLEHAKTGGKQTRLVNGDDFFGLNNTEAAGVLALLV